jgi:hypothetical protein
LTPRYSLGVLPRRLDDPGDTGTMPVNQSGFWDLVDGGGAETRTLPDPSFVGQIVDIFLSATGGGSIAITADSDIDQSGNNVMTFDTVGEHLRLIGIADGAATKAWRVVQANGVTLA